MEADERGWSGDSDRVARYSIVRWLHEEAEPSRLPSCSMVANQLGLPQDQVVRTIGLLQNEGLAKPGSGTVPAAMPAWLTSAGHSAAAAWAKSYASRRQRNVACRDALLEWLYDRAEPPGSIDPFLGEPHGHYFGKPFSEEDAEAALDFLQTQGLVDGISVAERSLLRPVLTANGLVCVEQYDSSVVAWLTRLTTSTREPEGSETANRLLHVHLRRGGAFSTTQASLWDQTEDDLRQTVLDPRDEGRSAWLSGTEFPWEETTPQILEGPPTAALTDFQPMLGVPMFAFDKRFRDVTNDYITGPPGKASRRMAPVKGRQPARFQVFLSSTFTDLQAERQEVTQALLRMGRCIPAGMELFGASSLPPWEFITRVLDVTDYFVLVLGQRYGSAPPEGGRSYTEREYDYATEHQIPVLAFMPGAERLVLESNVEQDSEKRAALAEFRARVEAAHLVVRWTDPHDLAQKVKDALYSEFEITPRPGWVRGETP